MIVVTVLDEEEEGSPADRRGAALVPPHTLEPGYSHLYSIPQPPQHQHHGRGGVAARVTLAFRDNDHDHDNDGSAVCELLLRSGDRLRVAS